MRCANNFFLSFWRRRLAACQRRKYVSHLGSLGERSFPRSATAIHSVAVDRAPNLSVERRTLYH